MLAFALSLSLALVLVLMLVCFLVRGKLFLVDLPVTIEIDACKRGHLTGMLHLVALLGHILHTLGVAFTPLLLGDETITIKVELGKLGWATPGVIFRLCCNGNEPAHDKPCHGQ